jgi:hypothetical protein
MIYQKITENKHFLTIILTITVISLILLLINIYYKFHRNINKYSIKSKAIYAKKPYTIPNKVITQSLIGHEYTYSLWIYIDNWEYKKNIPKHIFHIGDPNANITCPGVWIQPSNNNISIKFQNKEKEYRYTNGKVGMVDSGVKCIFPYKWNWEKMKIDKPNKITNELKNLGFNNINNIPNTLEIDDCETTIDKYSNTGYCVTKVDKNGYSNDIRDFGSCSKLTMNALENSNIFNDDDICTVKNVPFKQWFHLVINSHESIINVYINGYLYKSCPLDNIPKFNKGDLFITQNGGFDGMISQFRIFPNTISHQDVYKIYSRGPNNDNHIMKFPNLNVCHLCSKL